MSENNNMTTFSMEQVKVILKMHEETMMNFMKITVERFDSKFDEIKKDVININRDIRDLKDSANFSGNQINDIEKKLMKTEEKLKSSGTSVSSTMVQKIDTVFLDNTEIKEKLVDLEDRSRRNNLRINGIEEDEKETSEVLEQKINKLIKEDLEINKDITIERMHRSGAKKYRDGNINSKRVIVMKFLNFKDKELILEAFKEKRLWDQRIYINEDYSEGTLSVRKHLFNTAKQLRSQGKFAKVSYRRLITNENEE